MKLNQVDKSVRPYYDTFDEAKGYHQVLFKPARAVQTREVNEMQSILQNQISQFGNNIFENGTKVVGGEINYDLKARYIKISNIEWEDIVGYISNPDILIKSDSSTVTARVSYYVKNEGDDAITLYLKYETGDASGNTFTKNQNLKFVDENGLTLGNFKVSDVGEGSLIHINNGYYFVNGYFVYTPEQHGILSKYSNKPTVNVGFVVKERFVTSDDDQSLLDNASGTTNFNAIGADRLKLSLELKVSRPDEEFDKKNYIKLATFIDGELQEVVNRTDYNIIRDEMARRSYDTNGDYTVKPFNVFIDESKDETKYRIGVEAGKAYVRGYEIEKLVTSYVESSKARDTYEQQNATQELDIGAYILVSNATSIPAINTIQEFEFFDQKMSGNVVAGDKIGSCFVRQVRFDGTDLKLYVYNVKNKFNESDSSFIANAKSIRSNGGVVFAGNVKDGIIYNAKSTGLIYQMPADNIKTLKKGSTNDTMFTVLRRFTQRSGTDSRVSISCTSSEAFAPINQDSFVSFNNRVVPMSHLNPVYGRNIITMDIGLSNEPVTIVTGVVKQTSAVKTKAFTRETITLNNPRGVSVFKLNKVDVQKIVSVTQNGKNITHLFKLDDGITADYYAESKMLLKEGEKLETNENLLVEIEYFQHSGGDYFCVDSYTGIDYNNIPKFNGIPLTDCLDFRPNIFNSQLSDLPMSNTLTSSNVISYLPRIDLVVLSSSGEFSIVNGVSSLTPKAPEVPDNAMAIYRLNVPAFTGNVKEISMEYIDNKRYTMRDIGKIDKRVTKLEEAYTLSLLEVETDAMQVLDVRTGLNRYKNGFFVDNYTSHQNGAWADEGYKCSISREQAMLRPEFFMDSVDFALDNARSTGIRKTGDLITLNYNDINYISQPMASSYINVNPYAVLHWDGVLTIFPSSDIWFDTVRTNPEVHYSVYNNGKLTQSWNSWQLNWTGSNTTNSTSKSWSETNTKRTFSSIVTTRQDFTETTTTNEVTDVKVVNDRIVDTNVVPFMRSKEIEVTGKGFMPFTKLYAFFDNVNVTEYCTNLTDGTIRADRDGNVKTTFIIPNNERHKFRSGTKLLKLIDNVQNNSLTALTEGECEFTSQGVIHTKTQTINATKNITTTVSTDVKTSTTTINRTWNRSGGGRDPVAQSFFVTDSGGVFLTEIEVFFQSKDSTKPIRLELREMENGVPTLNIVPYGQVMLYPDEVNVSDNASVGTRFRFHSPVYLNENTEYCFVLLANSVQYNVWKATMGEVQIDKEEAIAKQPFIGVMFKSQNNTTWTEDQMSDLKFFVKRADFNISTAGQAVFTANEPTDIIVPQNPFTMTKGSNIVTAKLSNHGLIVGDKFTIKNCAGAYLGDNLFNKQQIVVSVIDHDTITFKVSAEATVSGAFGSDNVVITRNIQASLVQPVVQELNFAGTSIQYGLDAIAGKSVDGIEQAYTQTGQMNVVANNNNSLENPIVLPSKENMKTFKTSLHCNMASERPNVSPVIDLNRVGLIAVNNRVNYPADVSDELTTTNGKANARHISNVMILEEPATSLKIIADLHKPQNTDILYYYRTGNSIDEINSRQWIKMNAQNAQSVTKTNEYKEFTFGVDNIAAFNFYQIKTVLLSKSSTTVPSVKRFRCLALGT